MVQIYTDTDNTLICAHTHTKQTDKHTYTFHNVLFFFVLWCLTANCVWNIMIYWLRTARQSFFHKRTLLNKTNEKVTLIDQVVVVVTGTLETETVMQVSSPITVLSLNGSHNHELSSLPQCCRCADFQY